MKADPAAQRALLDLQAQDSALAQIAHRRARLPEHEQVAAADERIRELTAQRVETQTRVSDLERALRKSEGEVELVRSRRTRDEDRMASGAITSPKELASLQSELEALARRISTLEDEELEIMEQLESAQGDLAGIDADLETQNTARADVVVARDAKEAELDGEAQQASAARATALPDVPADLLALYEKVAANHGGLGAAALQGRRCTGCHLEINGADLRELTAEPADAVLRCPECSRILVRDAERA